MDGLVRSGIRAVGWAIMAIVGVMAFWMAGWVPPELAAMLGSRFNQSRTDPAALPARRPPAAPSTRRGTPQTMRADSRSPSRRGR